jgi:hypothetical protein
MSCSTGSSGNEGVVAWSEVRKKVKWDVSGWMEVFSDLPAWLVHSLSLDPPHPYVSIGDDSKLYFRPEQAKSRKTHDYWMTSIISVANHPRASIFIKSKYEIFCGHLWVPVEAGGPGCCMINWNNP